MKSITINQYFFYGDTCPKCCEYKTDERTRTVGFYKKSSDWSKEREVEFLSALPEPWAETHKSEHFFGVSPASFGK